MANHNDTQLLLELVKEIKSSQTTSVDRLQTTINRMDRKIDDNLERDRARYKEILMKIETDSELHAQLKTDHMVFKNSLDVMEKDVRNLKSLRNWMMGIIAVCGGILALVWPHFIDLVKRIGFIVSSFFVKER